MAAADRLTIDSGTSGAELMERAGRAVARVAIDELGGRYGRRVLVLCGKGNNGGDGFVVARLLAREGIAVTCMLTFDPAEAKGDAAEHLDRMRRAGVEARRFDLDEETDGYDAVVDAIFGTGFRGSAEGEAARAIEATSGHPCVVSVDIPSGVDGATGAVQGPVVSARVTVAMAAEKIGTAVPPGSVHAGRVEVADIGIDPNVRHLHSDGAPARGVAVGSFIEMAEAADVATSLSPRSPASHKRSVGSVAVLAGSDEMRGAALLTARGAMRMGAGYVTLGTTAEVKDAAAASLPELLCREVSAGGVLDGGALERFSDVIERADALALGPGLGTGDEQVALVARVLAEVEVPVVLDADALNVLAGDVEPLRRRARPTVITPHPAELGRLLQVDTPEVVADRVGAALEAAARFPSVVVLAKGHRTVIAYGGGKAAVVIPVGGPELATAGTGDVLTGALTAVVAGGSPPVGAAISAAYVHGVAGSVAGQRVGASGVVAGDVADALPEAVFLLSSAPL
jgi:NAD(P)H-hydrate epimerase